MVIQPTNGKLLLVDANSLIHRAYHALPPLNRGDGRPTGALYGLASILIKIMREDRPRYAVAAFDRPEPTFRDALYAEYKATRPPAPDDLIWQIKEARNLLAAFGVVTVEEAGYEADDLIATLAKKFKAAVGQVEILSGDLDILQVVEGDKVVADVPKRGISETKTYNAAAVRERFGIEPEQMADYKALVGDTSDNIPGVSGIGPKTAADLINEFGSLAKIYDNLAKIEKEKASLAAKLRVDKDKAFLSRELATIATAINIPMVLAELDIDRTADEARLNQYFKDMGFESLQRRLETEIEKKQEKPKSETGKLFRTQL